MTRAALLGFDLGGTNLRGALADADGMPIVEAVEATTHGSAAGMLDQMAAMSDRLVRMAASAGGGADLEITACGLGLAAAVEPGSGLCA